MRRTRPSQHATFMEMAEKLSGRSTCARRAVGCILTNSFQHIIGSGYNGNARGAQHCISNPCAGAHLKSGEGLGVCEAIHAEQNALMQCSNVWAIHCAYVTTPPCEHCIKLLLNTSCTHLFVSGSYPGEELTRQKWEDAGREYVNLADTI